MGKIKIAVCQSEIVYLQTSKNLAYARKKIQEAAAHGAGCIVFPEMSFTGFSMETTITSASSAETMRIMQECAICEKIVIGFGWTAMTTDGMAENHYAFIGKNGEVLLDYVKIHPFSYADEDSFFRGGTSLPTAILYEGLPFACIICYDLRFPELLRSCVPTVRAAFVPANWPAKRAIHWKTLLRARAIENQMYIIGVNCVGEQDGLLYSGDSMVIAPDGTILCDCKDAAGLFYAEISTEEVDAVRRAFPALRDRKPDLYPTL